MVDWTLAQRTERQRVRRARRRDDDLHRIANALERPGIARLLLQAWADDNEGQEADDGSVLQLTREFLAQRDGGASE